MRGAAGRVSWLVLLAAPTLLGACIVHLERNAPGRIDPRLLDPVCRLSGSGYARLGELVNVARPFWKDVKSTKGQEAMPRAVKR